MRTTFRPLLPVFAALLACTPLLAQETTEQEAAPAPEAATQAAPPKIPFLKPRGVYADLPEMGFSPMDLLGGGGGPPKPFFQFLAAVDGLAKVEQTAVLLDLSGRATFNMPQLRELERALGRVRAAGKKVTCYLETGDPGTYLLACACDRILMADMGALDLRSPAMSVLHLKDALDMLGIGVEVTRVGEWKGAVEPYTLPTMSDHLRTHYEAMLRSINDDLVRRIATARGLEPEKVRAAQVQRLITAADAKQAGLVDDIVPWAGAERALAALQGGEIELEDAGPKKKRQSRDLMAILGNLFRQNREEEIEEPQLVVLHLSGQIVDGDTPQPGSIVSGVAVAKIDELADEELVRGVVVRINSPGGSATASEAVRLALERLAAKKPVVFSMGELAASGGYWITAIGRPIVADVATITGSIGVFGMRFQPGALMRRIGVHADVVRLDDGPLMDAIDRPWSDAARERMQSFVDDVYARFLALVAKSRGKQVDEIDAIAGGRVWSGQQAVENGLVDAVGGLDDAIARVRTEAQLGDDVEVLHLPEPKNFADTLFSSLFEAQIESTGRTAALGALLGEGVRWTEALGVVRDALCEGGVPHVYALLPSGLRLH